MAAPRLTAVPDRWQRRPMHVSLATTAALLLLVTQPCDGLYVRVRQGSSRCFIEILEKHVVVMINYKSPDQSPLPQEPEVRKVRVSAGYGREAPHPVPYMNLCPSVCQSWQKFQTPPSHKHAQK